MSKKKNNRQNAEKETQKGPVQNEYTVSATLIDCTYCEELQKELEETKKSLKLDRSLRYHAEDENVKLRHAVERNAALCEYTMECLKWAKEHLGFFTLRKYKELFNQKAFTDFIIRRRHVYIATGKWIHQDADADILNDIRLGQEIKIVSDVD